MAKDLLRPFVVRLHLRRQNCQNWKGCIDPLNDPSLPKILVKEEFELLIKCNESLRRYGSWWRAVFANLVVLIAIAGIGWLVWVNTDLDKPGPWWLYILVVALIILGILHGQNFFVYLYYGIRYMPLAIEYKRTKSLLIRAYRGRMSAWDSAYEQKLMAEVIRQMDPKET